MICSDDNQIYTISYTSFKVILFQLQPVKRPFGRLIRRINIKCLDHQPFTAILDTLVQKLLQVFKILSVDSLGEHKLAWYFLELRSKSLPPRLECLLELRLIIKEEQVKCLDGNLCFEIFFVDVFPRPLCQSLKWKNLFIFCVVRDQL